MATTEEMIEHMLALLPEDDDDPEWERLSEWEQGALPSFREQFEERGTLSEKQYEILTRMYDKLK